MRSFAVVAGGMETQAQQANGQTPAFPGGTPALALLPWPAIDLNAPLAVLRTHLDHHERRCADLRRAIRAQRARRPHQRNPIREAQEFIAANPNERLLVKVVARHVGLSSSEFSRRWNKATGISLREYIARLCIKRAKKLLRETDMKIFDLALEAGFQSEPTFYRLFRKLTGKSPKQYRRRGR